MEEWVVDNNVKYTVPPKDVMPARNILNDFPWNISTSDGLELYIGDRNYGWRKNNPDMKPEYVYHLVPGEYKPENHNSQPKSDLDEAVLEINPEYRKHENSYETRIVTIHPSVGSLEGYMSFELTGAKHNEIEVASLLIHLDRKSFFRMCRRGDREYFLKEPK